MGSGAVFFDYDADGWVDLFLVDGGSLADAGGGGPRAPSPVSQPRQRDVRRRHRGVGDHVRASTAWAPAPATWTTTAASTSTSPTTAPTPCIRNAGNGVFADVTRTAGVGLARLEHELRVPGRGSRRRPGSLRRQLPRRAEDQQPVLRRSAAPHPRLLPPAELQGPAERALPQRRQGRVHRRQRRAPALPPHVGNGLGVAVGDYDDDGCPTCSWPTTRVPNFLFHNEGSGRFTEVGLLAGVSVARDGKPRAGHGHRVRRLQRRRPAGPGGHQPRVRDPQPVPQRRAAAPSPTRRWRAAWGRRRCRLSASASRSSTPTTTARWTWRSSTAT